MSKQFRPTWLYVKQHNITGLKYFGKTVKDPEKYLGSGLHWRRHLKEHGNDITTVWSKLFLDEQSLNEFALQFSKENNIVESLEWANLKPENGFDGTIPGTKFSGKFCEKMRVAASKPRSEAWKASASRNRKGKQSWNKGMEMSEDFCQKMSELNSGGNNPMFGRKHSDETRKLQSEKRKGVSPGNKGTKMSEEAKLARRERMRLKKAGLL